MNGHPEDDPMPTNQPEDELENAFKRNQPSANPFAEIARKTALARSQGLDPLAYFDLDAIGARLKALPVRQPATLQCKIEKLAPALIKLRGRGYSLQDLVAELQAVGITVSARTLARHLRAVAPKKSVSALQ